MRCPSCSHRYTRIIRTRPDPQANASELVRMCKDCSCVFTSREAIISVIQDSAEQRLLLEIASRIEKLPEASRIQLAKLVQLG